MRVGMNPQKQAKKIELQFHHRLIIVVFVPELDGYYKGVFEVFKLCLESAIATTNTKCAITVVNNASCKEVGDYLNDKFQKGEVNCVIHHNENIGKMDALIGAARGSREPIITTSDVDILFKQGWQEATEEIFSKMNNVASVSPISVRKSMRYGTTSTLEKILRKKVKFYFEPIPENHEDYTRYVESFHWEKDDSPYFNWPVVEQNGVKAILGSGHQIITMNRKILFKNVPTPPSLTLVGNRSEFSYCDEPVDMSGGMRLATYHNYGYHMGNTVEQWMLDIQLKNLDSKKDKVEEIKAFTTNFQPKTNRRNWFKFKQRIIVKLFNVFYAKKIDLEQKL